MAAGRPITRSNRPLISLRGSARTAARPGGGSRRARGPRRALTSASTSSTSWPPLERARTRRAAGPSVQLRGHRASRAERSARHRRCRRARGRSRADEGAASADDDRARDEHPAVETRDASDGHLGARAREREAPAVEVERAVDDEAGAVEGGAAGGGAPTTRSTPLLVTVTVRIAAAHGGLEERRGGAERQLRAGRQVEVARHDSSREAADVPVDASDRVRARCVPGHVEGDLPRDVAVAPRPPSSAAEDRCACTASGHRWAGDVRGLRTTAPSTVTVPFGSATSARPSSRVVAPASRAPASIV